MSEKFENEVAQLRKEDQEKAEEPFDLAQFLLGEATVDEVTEEKKEDFILEG